MDDKFETKEMARISMDFDVTGNDGEVDAIIILMQSAKLALKNLDTDRRYAVMNYIQDRLKEWIKEDKPAF